MLIWRTKKGELWNKEKEALTRARLIADGLVVRAGDTFTLTEKGKQEAKQFTKDNPGWAIRNTTKLDG